MEDGVNGLLVAPGDVDSLTAAIDRLDRECDLLAELGNGSRRSRGRFETRHVVSMILRQMGVDSADSGESLDDAAAGERVPSVR